MCGRFVSSNSPEEIASYFGASLAADPLEANYNVAPTDEVYAIVHDGAVGPSVRVLHWGLVPVWAKDIKVAASLINARAESIVDKPAFRTVFRTSRCIIPMTGFYEWQRADPNGVKGSNGKPVKQPVFVHCDNGEPMAVAGVWSAWRDRTGPRDAPWLHSCAVITTSASDALSVLHDRMPVILDRATWQQWLDPMEDDVAMLASLLATPSDATLAMHRVSTQVNSVRNAGPELIEPLAAEPAATLF